MEIICPHCKEEIPMQMVQQGGLHLHCYETIIEPWFISLSHTPKHGFYEADLSQVIELLSSSDCEDAYLIQKKEMKAGQYYNLIEMQNIILFWLHLRVTSWRGMREKL